VVVTRGSYKAAELSVCPGRQYQARVGDSSSLAIIGKALRYPSASFRLGSFNGNRPRRGACQARAGQEVHRHGNTRHISYVVNNPVNAIDPTGFDFWDDLGDFFGDVFHFQLGIDRYVLPAVAGILVGYYTGCPVCGAALAGALAGGLNTLYYGGSIADVTLSSAIGGAIGAAAGALGDAVSSSVASATASS
jgi:hypothetical protein